MSSNGFHVINKSTGETVTAEEVADLINYEYPEYVDSFFISETGDLHLFVPDVGIIFPDIDQNKFEVIMG